MSEKPLTEQVKMGVALNAAAYMRWVEIRLERSSHGAGIVGAIRGVLDNDGISYTNDDCKQIEILALALNVDMVEAYIKESEIFDEFDRAYRTLHNVKES